MAFENKAVANISNSSGSPTTISDTVAASTTHTIIGLSISNTSTSNITVSAILRYRDTTNVMLVKDATVLPGGALVVVGGDQKLVLEPLDSVRVYASAANAADAVLSYLV